MSPHGLTARELFVMAYGRKRQTRIHAIEQAALVWGLDKTDVCEFIRCGTLPASAPRKPLAPQLQANVDKYIQQIVSTGKLVVE